MKVLTLQFAGILHSNTDDIQSRVCLVISEKVNNTKPVPKSGVIPKQRQLLSFEEVAIQFADNIEMQHQLLNEIQDSNVQSV